MSETEAVRSSLSPGAWRRASIRGTLGGAPLGALVAAGLDLASNEMRGLLPFAVGGGLVFGAVIGWLAAVTAMVVLALGERRADGRDLQVWPREPPPR